MDIRASIAPQFCIVEMKICLMKKISHYWKNIKTAWNVLLNLLLRLSVEELPNVCKANIYIATSHDWMQYTNGIKTADSTMPYNISDILQLYKKAAYL